MTAGSGSGELLFLPLGGAGEIGMNLNLYCFDGKWLMVDLGITFADETLPGVEVVLPDPGFIVERRDDLVGLVLTHAHEDHLGAVPYLWNRLRCPVYATPFAAAVLRRKLARDGAAPGSEDLEITEVPLGGRFQLGPFDIEFISLTHSIPEPNALAIRTPAGTVLHTGDFKIDPDPLVGGVTDDAALRRLGDDGVLAMVCDSTNVFRPGESGSEGDVRTSLIELVAGHTGRVAVACFASNVARINSIAAAAEANGRHVALVGRSLWRITDAARETGYLDDNIAFLKDREAAMLPPDKVLYLCTGCQGEPRAALSRIAAGDHRYVSLGKGDVAIFSSKIIPGNELAINRLHNRLIALGVEVVTEDDHFVHVSGHPCRGELAQMYQWVRPRIAVPVHGEARHLVEHARFARSLQVPQSVVVENGDVLRLAPGPVQVVDRVAFGRLVADGNAVVSAESPIMLTRRRLMHNGVAFVTLALDGDGRLLADPRVTSQGLFHPGEDDEEEAVLAGAAEAVRVAFAALSLRAREADEVVREAVVTAVRRRLKARRGKRPVIEVQIVRL
ncbi:MAG: ribonuclease J [Proteobacteria bacterium]|nr:ribonuclease J [Pseudomonadota bacterium]